MNMMNDKLEFLVAVCSLMVTFSLCYGDVINPPDEWYRMEFPNPQQDLDKCGRNGKSSYVCDPNHVIKQEEADQLDIMIKDIWEQTKCPCSANTCDRNNRGYTVSIGLLKKISTHPANVPAVTAPTTTPHHKTETQLEKERIDALDNSVHEASLFASHLLNTWKFGQCEEHLVLLYSVQDNVVYTMTGQEARKKLKESLASEIQLGARVNLSPGKNIMEGLRQIILNYKKVFQGNYKSNIVYGDKPKTGELKSGVAFTQISLTSILASILSVLCVLLQ